MTIPKKKFSDGQFLTITKQQPLILKAKRSQFIPKQDFGMMESSDSNKSQKENERVQSLIQIKIESANSQEETKEVDPIRIEEDYGQEIIDMEKLLTAEDHQEIRRLGSEFTPASKLVKKDDLDSFQNATLGNQASLG